MILVERIEPSRDLDAIMAIETASFTNPWTREAIAWELEHSDVARVWVLRVDGGPPVAFCSCWLIFDELHIHTLAVQPDQRRRGYARTLLQAVLRHAGQEGARSAALEVRESNEPAIRLYQQAGFVIKGKRLGYYEKPSEDALILGLDSVPALADPDAVVTR